MAQIKDNLLELEVVYSKLNKALDENISRLNTGATAVENYNKKISVVPSEFQKSLTDIKTKTDAVTVSTEKLNQAKTKAQAKTSEEIVNGNALRRNSDLQVKSTSSLVGAYENLSAKVAIASKRYQDIIVRGRLATQTQRQYNLELRVAQREFQTLQARVLQADKAVDKWNRTGERSIGFAKNLMGAFGVVGGAFLFAQITRDIFETTKEIQSLDKALAQVTGTAENFANQQAFLRDISEAFGLEINGLTKQFTQFYVSAKDKISSNEIQGIFRSVSKAGAVMGLSVQSQERAFLALNQMMSKGTIQAEELRGQLGEALPGAFGIMAKAVGTTEAGLAKMMKAGDLLASDVLPKFAEQLEKTYGIETINRIETLTSNTARLSNAWTDLVRSMNDSETGGISNFFNYFLTAGTNALNLMRRLNSSWDELNDKASNSGASQGSAQFNAFAKGKSDFNIEIQLQNKTNELLNQQAVIYQKITELKKQADSVGSGINFGKSPKTIRKEIEQLYAEAGGIEGFLDSANKWREEHKKTSDSVVKSGERTIKVIDDEIKIQKELISTLSDKTGKEGEAIKAKIKALEAERELIYRNDSASKKQKEAEEKFVLGSIGWYQKRISKLTEEAEVIKKNSKVQISQNEAYQTQLKVISDLQKGLDKLLETKKEELKLGNELNSEIYSQDFFDKQISNLESRLKLINRENEAYSSLNEQLQLWKDMRDAMYGTGDEQEKATEKLEDFANYYSGFVDEFKNNSGFGKLFDLLATDLEKFKGNAVATALAVSDAFQEAFNTIANASQSNFDKEYELNELRYTNALKFANGNAEAEEALLKEKERREKEIAIREAKAQKKLAMFNIAINGAQAITATLGKTGFAGIPLAAIVGTLVAAQLALVASQEIPEYWKGTDNAPEGWAKTNERGAEIHTDSKGNIKDFGTNKGTQVKYLSKGDKIINANKTKELLSLSSFNKEYNDMLFRNKILPPIMMDNSNNVDLTPVVNELRAIRDKSEVTIVDDENGRRYYEKKNNATMELKNSRIYLKSRNVRG